MQNSTHNSGVTKAAIELHDSDVDAISSAQHMVTICLRAYVHRSIGTPGTDPGTGWIQPATITISRGEINGAVPELPGTISSGDLKIGNHTICDVVPCDFECEDEVAVDLVFTSGHRLLITGAALTIHLSGEPEFVDHFPGSND
jgi:hypothetical protein